MKDLFDLIDNKSSRPLAERMKPEGLDEFVGQDSIMGPSSFLREMIESDQMSSVIIYGPPGTGKTSLARIIAGRTDAKFITINAVSAGIKDIKTAAENASEEMRVFGKKTILFIDEIHRFNKLQQDALLPFVEKGDIVLIGATTENPYFEVNSALISRSSIFRLEPLAVSDIVRLLKRAATDPDRGFGSMNLEIPEEVYTEIAEISSGDARRALNILEMAVQTRSSAAATAATGNAGAGAGAGAARGAGAGTTAGAGAGDVIKLQLSDIHSARSQRYDKSGQNHYDIISAFIKSMRGSDPDAAVHYLARMIEGAEDPMFIARRIVICAAEDVGNADPQALILANAAMNSVHVIGMPEARIILSQAAIYVAAAPKSSAAYMAINAAISDVQQADPGPVPVHLRDGTSNRMTGDSGGYKYPHDFKDGYTTQQYMPDSLLRKKTRYYRPAGRGYEAEIQKYLNNLQNNLQNNKPEKL